MHCRLLSHCVQLRASTRRHSVTYWLANLLPALAGVRYAPHLRLRRRRYLSILSRDSRVALRVLGLRHVRLVLLGGGYSWWLIIVSNNYQVYSLIVWFLLQKLW